MIRRVLFILLSLGAMSVTGGQTWQRWLEEEIPPRSGIVEFASPTGGAVRIPQRDFAGENVPASAAERPQNEVSLAVNPWNPDHIVGGCNDYREGETTGGWYTTFDGGLHWENGLLPGLDEFDAAGNPTLAMDRQGTVWFAGIHFNRDNDNGGLFVFRSEDGGLEWEDLGYIIVHPEEAFPPFEDKPMLRIDQTEGRFDGNLYVSWTRFGTGQIYFSRSLDRGERWSEPLLLYDLRGQGSIPVITPEGDLYVFWIDYSFNRIVGRKSVNGGESFGDIIVISDAQRLPSYLRNRDVRVNSVPSAVCDQSSGQHRGRMYIAWADIVSGDPDILMVFSDDGENWSDAQRLNDDEFQNDLHQFFPWLSVDDDTGVLSAVWYDRRNDAGNILLDVYGLHWGGDGELPANERITDDCFDPRQGAFNGRFIGDQIGVISAGGIAHAGWSDTRAGEQDIYSAQFIPDRFPFERLDGEREFRFSIEAVTIDGQPAEAEDAVLIYDAKDNLIAGAYCEDEAPYEVTINREWVENAWDYYTFRLWDDSEGRLTRSAFQVTEGDALLRDDGDASVRLAVPWTVQTIRLNSRWNLISTRVSPWTLDAWRLFYPWRESIGLVRNGVGHFLTYVWGFDNLGDYNPVQGYAVNLLSDELVLEFPGYPLPRDLPIQLEEGWNLVAYLPDYEIDNPVFAFPDIIDFIDLIKDDQGRFYACRWDFCNMRFHPDEGYYFRMNRACALVWPPEEEGLRQFADDAPQNPQHFRLEQNGSTSMSILITALNSEFSPAGETLEVGAFNRQGRLCGAAVLSGEGPWGMGVWGRESLEKDGFGASSGEELTFRLWNPTTGAEFELEEECLAGGTRFDAEDYSVLELSVTGQAPKMPGDFTVMVNPNPLNARGSLEFYLPQSGWLKAVWHDTQGRNCGEIYEGILREGLHRLEFDCESLNSGLYFLSLSISGKTIHKRVVILK